MNIVRPAAAYASGQAVPLSAVEELVGHIRSLIDTEGLGVGDNLPSERELCERFETSRNTVREAMRMLKAYGVVIVRPKVGAIIADNRMERVFDLFSFNTIDISRETFTDIQGFRSLLEVGSVDLIFDNATASDIADLRKINAAMRDALNTMEAAEFDFRFHVRLVTIIGNRAARDVYRIMKPVIIRIIQRAKELDDFRINTFNQHKAIIDALEERNRISYQYALQSHLDAGIANFQRAIDENNEELRMRQSAPGNE